MAQVAIDLRHRPQPTPVAAWPAHRRWLVPSLLALILSAYVAQVFYFHDYVNDDAFITYRYSRSLAHGLGPFYNPGQHVEGYTSPSMMLIVAASIRLFGENAAPQTAKAVGLLSGVLCIMTAFLFTRFLGRRLGLGRSAALWGLGAAAVVALNPGFALNSISGLETTLFAVLLLAGAALAVGEQLRYRWLGSGVAFALAALTRPEGILLFAMFWLTLAGTQLTARLRPHPLDPPLASSKARRLLIINGLIVTATLAVHLVWRYFTYDGEWLPNTYYAKLGGFLHENTGGYIADGILPAFMGSLGLIAALIGLATHRKKLRLLLPVAVMAAGCLLPFWTGRDWMPGHRLVVPYLPLMATLVTLGWALLVGRLKQRWWVGPLALVTLVAGLFVTQSEARSELHSYVETRAEGYLTGHTALAHWLNSQTAARNGPVALMDIGLVGYYCPERDIIDITGLTDRNIAKSEGGFLAKEYDPGYILAQRPEFIVLTLTAPGLPDGVPPSPQSLRFWTPIERRLYYSPEFQKSYVSHAGPHPTDGSYDPVARRFGAERVFEHAHPDTRYLLAVFRHRETSPGDAHASVADHTHVAGR